MLTVACPFLLPEHIERDLPTKLRNLADDVERLRRRGRPQFSDLDAAPRLDDWAAVMTPQGVRLIGFVTGHPLRGDRAIMTSALWVADAESSWVRTLSRFYRLGTPSDLKVVKRASKDGT